MAAFDVTRRLNSVFAGVPVPAAASSTASKSSTITGKHKLKQREYHYEELSSSDNYDELSDDELALGVPSSALKRPSQQSTSSNSSTARKQSRSAKPVASTSQ